VEEKMSLKMSVVTAHKEIQPVYYQQELATGAFAKTTQNCYEYENMKCIIVNFDPYANSYLVYTYKDGIKRKVWIHRKYLIIKP
jgi:hypothetical protein